MSMTFEDKMNEARVEERNKNHYSAYKKYCAALHSAEEETEKEKAKANAYLQKGIALNLEEPIKAATSLRNAANIFYKLDEHEKKERSTDEIKNIRDSIPIYDRARIQDELLRIHDIPNKNIEEAFYYRYRGITLSKKDNFDDAIEELTKSVKKFENISKAGFNTNRHTTRTKAELFKIKGYKKMQNYKFQIARSMFREAKEKYSLIHNGNEVVWCKAWEDIARFFLTRDQSHLEGVDNALPDPDGGIGDGFKKGVITYVHSVI